MMTRTELSKALASVNTAKVAEMADVSTKTIYRIRRDEAYMPTLGTFLSIEKAIRALRKPKRSKAAA